MMGWFFKSTGMERQQEVYQEQMDERQKELDKLDGVDTAESAARREQLSKEIAELEIAKEGVRSGMEQQGVDRSGGLLGD